MNEAELKHAILNKLMFVPTATYSELHEITENHDLFNYHLRELVNRGLIAKEKSSYTLTTQGRQQVALMEEDGKYQKQFKVSMFINMFRKHNGKWQMYLHRRKKHPHYDYVGAITGKLKWGDSLESNMTRELQEELGVKPLKYDVVGVHREIFHDEQGERVGDGVFFVISVTEWEGVPIEKNIEGEYFWYDLDKILDLDKIFRQAFTTWLPFHKKYLRKQGKCAQQVVEEGKDLLGF
jgi:ADP-ribose pyrophosphatase YjhB (NUDIX family)